MLLCFFRNGMIDFKAEHRFKVSCANIQIFFLPFKVECWDVSNCSSSSRSRLAAWSFRPKHFVSACDVVGRIICKQVKKKKGSLDQNPGFMPLQFMMLTWIFLIFFLYTVCWKLWFWPQSEWLGPMDPASSIDVPSEGLVFSSSRFCCVF